MIVRPEGDGPGLPHRQAASRRRGLNCCCNTKDNDPYKEHHYPGWTSLTKVDNSAIKAVGAKPARNDSFMDADTTIKADKRPAGAE
jgi:hypothetical protein